MDLSLNAGARKKMVASFWLHVAQAGDISELHNTSSAARLAMHSPLKLAPEKGSPEIHSARFAFAVLLGCLKNWGFKIGGFTLAFP